MGEPRSAAAEAAVAGEAVGKRYRRRRALHGCDFSIPTGAICGLVGPNGSACSPPSPPGC